MKYLRLMGRFIAAAVQQEFAYRMNFWIHLLYAAFNLIVAVAALQVLFGQVHAVRGWDYPATLALLGVYLTVTALRSVCLGPSLESLAGMDGELWTGRFDFTLLRPVDVQFLASFRIWRPFALLDLLFGLVVISQAVTVANATAASDGTLTLERLGLFFLAMTAGVIMIYAVLLAFSALVFWSPGLLFTWIFDAILQLARYPVGVYPAWLRIMLTWIVPVGLITTLPAQALTGQSASQVVAASLGLSLFVLIGASWLFRSGVRRYASASS